MRLMPRRGGETSAAELEEENRALKAEVAALREKLTKADVVSSSSPLHSAAMEMEAKRRRVIESEAAGVEALEAALAAGMSASSAALLLGPNVSLEYTRDSPMFRRSTEAFEETLGGLEVMVKELCELLRAWSAAQSQADAAARAVSAWMRDRRHARSLFSGAHASLGDLSETLADLAGDIEAMTSNRSELAYAMSELAGRLAKFRTHEVGDVAGFRERTWKLGDEYEAKLSRALVRLSKDEEVALETSRRHFETARFALVRHLNGVDAKKRLVLTAELFEHGTQALRNYYARGLEYMDRPEAAAKRRLIPRALEVVESRARIDDALWDKVLDRLEAELDGELPPPGAPSSARGYGPPPRSSANPDLWGTDGAPPWSVGLSTEVLSQSSLDASRRDLAHARDEAVLKQGYLHRRDVDGITSLVESLASKNRRKWHRLHDGALYVVDAADERRLCKMAGCAVHRGNAGPFAFAIVRPDGHRLSFQAENDDELIRWISALRRSTKWHDVQALGKSKLAVSPHDAFERLASLAVDRQNARLVAQFAANNPTCAECDALEPEWVATALGIALCADCAAIHRRLGANFSRLRALWLDRWSAAMLKYLARAAGNVAANAVWESHPPPGWTRPGPRDAVHVKEHWIVAKYLYGGFVADDNDRPRGVGDHASKQLVRFVAVVRT